MKTNLSNLLLDQSRDLFWVIDLDFNLIFANKSYLKNMQEKTGVEKKLNESVFVGEFGGEYIEKWKAYYNKALKGEYFEIEEHYFNTQLNETLYSQIIFEPLKGDDDAFFGIACQSKDISIIIKQKFENEQRYKALIQEGSDLIRILDVEGNFIYVSPSSNSVLGIAPEEFIGKNALEFIHPDDVERTAAGLKKIITGTKLILEPYRFKNYKKEWRWLETVLTNMLENPAVKGILANSRDITDKIEEKHYLKLLESVITNTNDAVLITEAEPFDEPGPKIIYVNEAFTKMTGYTAEEIIGKTPRILQGPNSNKVELAKLGRSLRRFETCEITTINYKKNREQFWVNFSVSPVANEKGLFTHWIAIERDATEQKIKELGKDLLAKISINFNTENDYIIAANELCKTISKFGEFDWVELCTNNLEKSQMQVLSHYLADPKDEKFYSYSENFKAFNIAEGLSGKVWSDGVQLLWNISDENQDFVRRFAAKKIGLKAVLGIPLIFNKEMVGVLQIGTKNDANYLKNYSKIFKKLEIFLGSELNRKKLEYDLSHLFNTIPEIIC
jgi:PAS domain S-box-containing protein